MKKKSFFQTNILWQLLLLCILTIGIFGIITLFDVFGSKYGNITNFLNMTSLDDKLIYCVFLCGVIFPFYFFVQLERYNVHLNDEEIYMNDDWRRKTARDKIQYQVSTKYKDIEKINLIYSHYDSRDRNCSAFRKKYLVLETKDGKINKYHVTYFSKKTLIKLINEIKLRMKEKENIVTIDDTNDIIDSNKNYRIKN